MTSLEMSRRTRATPKARLSKPQALKVVRRLWALAREGPGPGRARQIQEGLRDLARGFVHSEEMLDRMSRVRATMGILEDSRKRGLIPPEVAKADANEAASQLYEAVVAHWPPLDSPEPPAPPLRNEASILRELIRRVI